MHEPKWYTYCLSKNLLDRLLLMSERHTCASAASCTCGTVLHDMCDMSWHISSRHVTTFSCAKIRLWNDLYCVGWGVILYSLTHSCAKMHGLDSLSWHEEPSWIWIIVSWRKTSVSGPLIYQSTYVTLTLENCKWYNWKSVFRYPGRCCKIPTGLFLVSSSSSHSQRGPSRRSSMMTASKGLSPEVGRCLWLVSFRIWSIHLPRGRPGRRLQEGWGRRPSERLTWDCNAYYVLGTALRTVFRIKYTKLKDFAYAVSQFFRVVPQDVRNRSRCLDQTPISVFCVASISSVPVLRNDRWHILNENAYGSQPKMRKSEHSCGKLIRKPCFLIGI